MQIEIYLLRDGNRPSPLGTINNDATPTIGALIYFRNTYFTVQEVVLMENRVIAGVHERRRLVDGESYEGAEQT